MAEAVANVVAAVLGLGLGAGMGLQPGGKHEIGVDPALALHVAGIVETAVAEEGNTVAAGKDRIPHIADNTADIVVGTTDLVLALQQRRQLWHEHWHSAH